MSVNARHAPIPFGGSLKLEVWQDRIFGRPKQIQDNLNAFIKKGAAYATWQQAALLPRRSQCIGMSDQLAAMVLGAYREPCPNAGQRPIYKQWGALEGYTFRYSSSDKAGMVLVNCADCGYCNTQPGSPLGGTEHLAHPKDTRLYTLETSASFEGADWSNDERLLTVSRSDGRLIIWVKSAWRSSLKWATGAFPDANVAHNAATYAVLQEPTKVSAAHQG